MSKRFLADTTLLLIAFVWGATFLVVQNAIAHLPPNTFNAVRFSLATLVLLAVVLIFSREQLRRFSRSVWSAGFILGFLLCLSYGLQTVGLLYTSSSKAGFITGLSVVLVPLFSYLFLREKLKSVALLGALAAAGGLYLLTAQQSLVLNSGDLLVFGCAICFGLQIVFTGKFAKQLPALPLAIVQLGTVALLSWLYACCFEQWQSAFAAKTMLQPQVAWGLLITAIPGTALAFLGQTALQKFTTSTRVALIFTMEPVFAALTAYVWINERLAVPQLWGCALILGGMLLAELPVPNWLKKQPVESKKHS
ncbi:DMT family transporter [Brevibacillus fulvus]|uniref:Drug/metabolite transporter (DMT)-like permease n=1 Tax=Brevibacillus fulvus TaxID=1125967 RepID=A0A939BP52_9BACL|nr:DMT family transporter [Brevibacillus fulvus]MBM7590055.1 drug/metabolite transporter (DMT)-like permease [Brevibacillus fulvus]